MKARSKDKFSPHLRLELDDEFETVRSAYVPLDKRKISRYQEWMSEEMYWMDDRVENIKKQRTH